jgi:hypothetical protein
MSVTVRARHEYPHPVRKVWAAFSDPEFYHAKFEGVGHRDVAVISSERDSAGFSIEVSREVPLEVPGFLRGMLGEWNRLLQSEHWAPAGKGVYANALEIEARGLPVTMKGAMRLSGRGEGAVNEIEITIRAAVPLIGGKLERFVARDTEAVLAAEYEFIQAFLDER